MQPNTKAFAFLPFSCLTCFSLAPYTFPGGIFYRLSPAPEVVQVTNPALGVTGFVSTEITL